MLINVFSKHESTLRNLPKTNFFGEASVNKITPSAIMTRLVGTFAAGFAVTLAIALLTSIEGAWLLFVYGFVQACIGAVVCFQTIHSYWGSVDEVI